MSKLPLDFKVDKIIKQISSELKIDYQTIVAILEAQCYTTAEGMKNGDTIVWKYFGTFVAPKKRVDMLNKIYKRKGFTPKLEDRGLIRLAFTKDGVKRAESVMESTSIKDLKSHGEI